MTEASGGWSAWRQALGRGIFPHQLAWFLELPARRLVLSPELLASRLPLHPDASVLEVGPGSGYYSLEVARCIPAGRLELFDLQPQMLARCRAKAEAAGLTNVGFTTGDGASLPFADAAFDLVYMVTVFGEVHDQAACLRSIRRVLKPAGALSVSEHMPDPDFTPFDALRRQVEASGFRLEARSGSRWAYTANFRVT
ncbi:MAG: class I SAM-dependent methyltransferase [Longimicrobiaceae bacterium]